MHPPESHALRSHASNPRPLPYGRGSDFNGFFIRSEFGELLRKNGIDSLAALFSIANAEPLHKATLEPWRERLRVVLADERGPRTLFVKRFNDPTGKASRIARRSGSGARSLAGNEWAWIERLQASGIPCPEAVAFGEEFRRGREIRSAILTAEVPGRSLENWCKEWTRSGSVRPRRLFPALARLIARFHAAGFVHRDLYVSHVFYDPDPSIQDSLCLIDLQRVMQPTWRRWRWVIKDLAALNFSAPAAVISRADRVRWLRYYRGTRRLGVEGKRLAYRVIGKTRSIARRDNSVAPVSNR